MAGIAGSVAPVFRGEYSTSNTYDFYHSVTYGNKLYFCKQDGTKGHTPSGKTDDYWFLSLDGTFADATSLGGETAEQWQTKLDNIQTTSRATLSTAGWYRVAELVGTTEIINHYTCLFSLVTRYGYNGCITSTFLLERVTGKLRISPIGTLSAGINPFTKVRVTTEGNKAYLEAYYSFNVVNICMFSVLGSLSAEAGRNSGYTPWKALDFEATSETVDGVTVTTTYDIPANASPVTDLDLENALHGVTILTALPTGITNDSTMQELINAMPTYSMLNLARAMSPLTPESYCELTVIKSTTAYVIAFAKSQYTSNVYMGGVNTVNEWDGWHKYATTADLANYLPIVNCEALFQNLNDAVAYTLDNGIRKGSLMADRNGNFGIWDDTAGGWMALSAAGGDKYFYGTATGNLPLTGGTITGDLTVSGSVKVGGQYSVLNTSNSRPVKIQESAPTDTTALWYDTVNKMCKRYVDGAWQA